MPDAQIGARVYSRDAVAPRLPHTVIDLASVVVIENLVPFVVLLFEIEDH